MAENYAAGVHPQSPDTWSAVRERLKAGEYVIGMTVTSNNVETAAYAATLGFHFLWAEMEHSSLSLESLRTMVMATRGLPAPVFARVPWAELWMAKRVLDQGVQGVIFPFISTPERAAIAAHGCHYPPFGRRGSGAGLAVSTWPVPGNYYDSADANVLVVCVIEEAAGVEEIEEIAATPGIDVIFIGVSDLSFSLGLRGRQDEPLLDAAIAKIVTAAQRHGKWLGRPAGSADEVKRFHAAGFQFFQSVTELGLMMLGAQQLLEPLGIKTSHVSRARFTSPIPTRHHLVQLRPDYSGPRLRRQPHRPVLPTPEVLVRGCHGLSRHPITPQAQNYFAATVNI